MTDTKSMFANENPNYGRGKAVDRGSLFNNGQVVTLQEIPENRSAPVDNEVIGKQKLKNDIYDNVKIDMSDPDGDTPGFCSIEGDKNEGANVVKRVKTYFAATENESSKTDAESSTPGNDPQGLEALLNSITKKQWLCAGGITAGILMLRGGNKK